MNSGRRMMGAAPKITPGGQKALVGAFAASPRLLAGRAPAVCKPSAVIVFRRWRVMSPTEAHASCHISTWETRGRDGHASRHGPISVPDSINSLPQREQHVTMMGSQRFWRGERGSYVMTDSTIKPCCRRGGSRRHVCRGDVRPHLDVGHIPGVTSMTCFAVQIIPRAPGVLQRRHRRVGHLRRHGHARDVLLAPRPSTRTSVVGRSTASRT